MTPVLKELEDYYAERAADDARKSASNAIARVLAGDSRAVYYQFAMTFEEADKMASVRLADLPHA